MRGNRLRASLVAGLMVVSFAVAAAWRPSLHMSDTKPKLDLERVFPKSFGAWRADDRGPVQLVSPDQQAVLNRIYNQTLSRVYVNPAGDRVMLSVAYGGDQSDGTRAHKPEVCYPAQGFQIAGSANGAVSLGAVSIPARRLVAKMGARVEPITYWFVVGEQVVLSGTEQKLAQLQYGIRGVIPDGVLVRVSTIDTDTKRAYVVQQQFISDMAPAIDRSQRMRLFGSGI